MNKDYPDFHLNTNIKYLRNIHKESQEELAKVIKKGYTSIGNYEKGIRSPDYMDLWLIAQHYNISVDDLIKKDLRFENKEKSDKNDKYDRQQN